MVNSRKLVWEENKFSQLCWLYLLPVLMLKVWSVLNPDSWWSHWKKKGEVGWHQAVAVSGLTAAHNTPPPLHCQVQSPAVPRQGRTLAHQGHAQDTRQGVVWATLCGDPLPQGCCTPDILFLFSWAIFHRFTFPLTRSVSVPWRERMELTPDRTHLPTDDLWPLTPAEFPILLGLLKGPAPPTAAHIATEQSRGVCRGCQCCVGMDTDGFGWAEQHIWGGCSDTHTPPPKGQWYTGLDPTFLVHPRPLCSQSDPFCGTINSQDLCAPGSGRRTWFHFQHSFFAFLPTFTLMITDVDSARVARETARPWLCSQADVNHWLIIKRSCWQLMV